MKSLLSRSASALCLSFGLLAGPAYASPVNFALNVVFDAGPLAGQTAVGSFAVEGPNCVVSLCSGAFTPQNGLLDFRITVDGVLFTDQMDSGYPYFPQIDLFESAVTFLTFAVDGLPSLYLSASPGGFAFGSYTPAEGLTSYVASDGISVSAIPEPTTAFLAALGLVGVAGVSSRRRRAAVEANA